MKRYIIAMDTHNPARFKVLGTKPATIKNHIETVTVSEDGTAIIDLLAANVHNALKRAYFHLRGGEATLREFGDV